MGAYIDTKKASLNMEFFKKTVGYIGSGTIDYVKEAMPVTTSTISEAKQMTSEVRSSLSGMMNDQILPSIKSLKISGGFKGITNWFLEKEDEFDFENGFSGDLSFDDGTTVSGAQIAEAQIGNDDKNANKIARAVVESSHQMVESQISAVANINASIDKQTAVISAGFDRTNQTLGKILDVLTKNTAAIIETNAAQDKFLTKKDVSANDMMVGTTSFSMSDYRNHIKKNFDESQASIVTSFASMLLDPNNIKMMLSPSNLIRSAISGGLNKAAPNLKKNMEALDNAVNETIMSSLIRIGEGGKWGPNEFSKIFGLDSTKKDVDKSRSNLELKNVGYNTLAQEYITSAIPGYLRKILVAVGGDDEIYDPRSRSFKTKAKVHQEYRDFSSMRGTLGGASSRVRQAFSGGSDTTRMLYDLMMNDLSSKTGAYGNPQELKTILKNFSDNPMATASYLRGLMGSSYSKNDKRAVDHFAKALMSLDKGYGIQDIKNQAARQAVQQNMRKDKYFRTADAYGMDLTDIEDSTALDRQNIIRNYRGGSTIAGSGRSPVMAALTGSKYTNTALYEIYRKLNKGINVYQVGQDSSRDKPFADYKNRYLARPFGYRDKNISDNSNRKNRQARIAADNHHYEDPLANSVDENGNPQELSRGQKFGRWGKVRGGQLINAMLTGSSDDVRDVFNDIVRDAGNVASSGMKKGLSKINDSFGNVSGYLKNKMFGTEYSYQDTDAKGRSVTKTVRSGNKGLFGFFAEELKRDWTKAKDSGKKWWDEVSGYFDYDGKDSEEKKLASKRKKLIGASVGAFAGLGILGGPIGVIAGGLAGSALSTNNLGEKLKGKLFGRDEKGKATGSLTKLFDKITRPIEYQIGKTINFVGNGLKKHVLGPISDVGFAIRKRLMRGANSLMTKFLWNPLKKVGSKIGKGILNGAGWLWEKGLGAAFGYQRAKLGVKGSIFGAGAEGLAKGIIGFDRESQRELKERKKNRNASIAASSEKYESYKTFNSRKDQEAAERAQRWRNYKNIDEITTTVNDMTDVMNETASAVQVLAEEGTKKGSIYVHDEGAHNYLKSIYEAIAGTRYPNDVQNVDPFNRRSKANRNASIPGLPGPTVDSGYANTALQAATIMGMSGDSLGNTELSLLGDIEKEARKDSPNTMVLSTKVRKMMTMQKGAKTEEGEKKESFMSKLLGGLGSIVSNLGGILKWGGILYLIFKDLNDEDGFIKRGFRGITEIRDFLKGDSNIKQPAAAGANLITAPLDMKVDNIMDYAIPGADIFHIDRDGSGENIKNQAASNLKDQLLWRGNATSLIRNMMSGGRTDGINLTGALHAGASKVAGWRSKYYNKRAAISSKLPGSRAAGKTAKWEYKANKQQQIAENHQSKVGEYDSSLGGNMIRTAKTMGGIGIASGVTGLGAKGISYGIARATGHSAEEASAISDTWGQGAGAATGGVLTAQAMSAAYKGTDSWALQITDSLTKLFKGVVSQLAEKYPKFGQAVSKIGGFLDDALKAVIGKLGAFKAKIMTKLTKALGEEAVTTLSFGIPIAIGTINGLLTGACDVEHLFGVLPDQADRRMTTISTIIHGLMGGLEWVPGVGLAVTILDIVDSIMEMLPITNHCGFKRWLASLCYKYLDLPKNWDTHKAKLDELQGNMSSAKDYYNQQHGTNLTDSEFNDFANVNNTAISRWMKGSSQVDAEGHLITRDDGGQRTFGGVINTFLGNDTVHVKDSEGNIIKGEDGKSIVQTDKWGNEIKNDRKFFDYIGMSLHSTGRQLFGGDVYKTDDKGNVIYDKNGNAQVDYHEKSFLGKIFSGDFKGAFVSDQQQEAWDKILGKDTNVKSDEDIKLDKIKGVTSDAAMYADAAAAIATGTGIGKPLQNMGNNLTISFTKMANAAIIGSATKTLNTLFTDDDKDQYELDENGKPIEYPVDADGKPLSKDGSKYVKKGDLPKMLSCGVRKVTGMLLNPFKAFDDNELKGEESKFSFKSLLATLTNTGAQALGGPDDSKLTPESYKSGGKGAKEEVERDEGGNPLNKDFRITSKYGPREYPHSGMHKGVDLVPADGTRDADIGSRFNGTIIGVKSNIPDNLHAVNEGGKWVFHGNKSEETGNMVTIQTDDGRIIKNMHIKAGSIPSNIRVGSRVKVGDKLGVMGSTGWSTGPHLHYQIEDGSNNPIDPTSSLSGTTISNFKSSSSSTYENTTDPNLGISSDITGSASVSGLPSTTSEGSTESSGSGPLGNLIAALRSAGGRFLSAITGGLIGSSASSSSESSTQTTDSSGVTHGGGGRSRDGSSSVTPGAASNITTTPNSQWIDVVRKVKAAVAEQQPIYYTEAGSFTLKLNVNGKQMSMRPDCSGLVGTMLKVYGAIPENQNITSSSLGNDSTITNGFSKTAFPGWDSLVEGDILVSPGSHTEVFAKNEGGKHYVYNGGSTKSLRNPGATVSSHSAYNCIWRCQNSPSSIAGTETNPLVAATTDVAKAGANIGMTAMGKVNITDQKGLWDYLRNYYSEAAVSGIMGAWGEETGNRADRLEGDYLLKPDFNATLASNEALDDYTVNKLFPMYDRNNLSINKSAYKYGDHYYPGIGLAQWTGERGQKLLDFSKSKGQDWRSYQTQLDYFKHEMDTKYDPNGEFKKQTDPKAAAEWFARHYEGNTKTSYFEARKKRASEIYDQFATKNDDMPTDGMGGADDSSIEYYNKHYGPTIGKSEFMSITSGSNTKARSQSSIAGRSNVIQFPAQTQNGQPNSANLNSIIGQSTDTTEIVSMLYQVIKLLEGINNNTGQSNTYLNTMSTLQASPNRKVSGGSMPSHSASHRYQSSNPNGNRMITGMIRP